MARIGYVGQGNNLRRLLAHSPEISDAYWGLRKAINEHSQLSPRLRILSFLASDVANRCGY
jgi:alkylhydroperoxidase/carboxymuconolactone decarboxylase family protein YurZ